MAGGFKRSGVFGIVGVFVVAAVVIAIAMSTGEGQSNPKTTYALIFGVLAAFFVILFTLQRSDMSRAAGGDAKAVQRAVAEAGGKVDDPTSLSEQQLWASLATGPIDNEAIEARGSMWDAGRRSLRLGMIVTLLIFLTVPSIYLFESFVPLLIGGPLIVLAAIYGSVRALMPGGEMDSAYRKVGVAMAPLGLEVTAKPKVNIEVREPVSDRVGPRVHGYLVLAGKRHGQRVKVRIGEGVSEVKVDAPCSPYAAKSKKVTVESGADGILVARKGAAQSEWLCDLWLAERLAGTC